jgi:hypothetical protein
MLILVFDHVKFSRVLVKKLVIDNAESEKLNVPVELGYVFLNLKIEICFEFADD